ncbi:MAG TPA: 1,4-alpha-glucan branching protein domain-containing protein [Solirubrobacterales bacterium]|nr:1,4-alpha-glucan branching protein domain-containing protein [Solirubrobacterales bacterium]
MNRPAEAGDIAIVLHSHMPYVKGFGTYPFGEEWLFDAFTRSHLPVLEVARDVTITITPVLADQLEDAATAARMRDFVRDLRLGSAERDAADVDTTLVPACRAEAERYDRALARLEELGDEPLAAFRAADGRVELLTSTATHALLPLIATREARLLQLETAIRSHRRRFGPPRGIWLPECAYEPGLEHLLAELGLSYFPTDQSAHEPAPAALRPITAEAAVTAFPIDWEAVRWLWSWEGYPSHPGHADFHRKSLRGCRPWAISGDPYDPAAAAARAREQGRGFARDVAARLRRYRRASGRRGLLTFAIDTELLGHWWWEGPAWLDAALAELPACGVRPLTLGEARAEHEPERRPLRASTWGEGKDRRTWDSPAVADLSWAMRRAELRVLRELGSGRLRGPALARAARELMALQASDWAFLDYGRRTGDYPFQRAIGHSRALFEAIECPRSTEPTLRSLAPDLTLAPLLEP